MVTACKSATASKAKHRHPMSYRTPVWAVQETAAKWLLCAITLQSSPHQSEWQRKMIEFNEIDTWVGGWVDPGWWFG